MEIVIGSKNPAKPASLSPLFEGTGCTLLPAPFSVEVAEIGRDPAENALLKAKAYARALGKPVVGEDSGLYFPKLPLDDPRQPGLTVRRVAGRELGDPEMIAHYAALAHELGGMVDAVWVEGYALCFEDGESTSYLRPMKWGYTFALVDHVVAPLRPGFPLDSISVIPEEWGQKARLDLRQRGDRAVREFFQREIEKHRGRTIAP